VRPIMQEFDLLTQEDGLAFQLELSEQDALRSYECVCWHLHRSMNVEGGIVSLAELWSAMEAQPEIFNNLLPGTFRMGWGLLQKSRDEEPAVVIDLHGGAAQPSGVHAGICGDSCVSIPASEAPCVEVVRAAPRLALHDATSSKGVRAIPRVSSAHNRLNVAVGGVSANSRASSPVGSDRNCRVTPTLGLASPAASPNSQAAVGDGGYGETDSAQFRQAVTSEFQRSLRNNGDRRLAELNAGFNAVPRSGDQELTATGLMKFPNTELESNSIIPAQPKLVSCSSSGWLSPENERSPRIPVSSMLERNCITSHKGGRLRHSNSAPGLAKESIVGRALPTASFASQSRTPATGTDSAKRASSATTTRPPMTGDSQRAERRTSAARRRPSLEAAAPIDIAQCDVPETQERRPAARAARAAVRPRNPSNAWGSRPTTPATIPQRGAAKAGASRPTTSAALKHGPGRPKSGGPASRSRETAPTASAEPPAGRQPPPPLRPPPAQSPLAVAAATAAAEALPCIGAGQVEMQRWGSEAAHRFRLFENASLRACGA